MRRYLATHNLIKQDASRILFIAPLPPRTARVLVLQTPFSCFSVMARLSKISMIFAYVSFLPTILLLHLTDFGVRSAGTALFSDGYANGVIGSGT